MLIDFSGKTLFAGCIPRYASHSPPDGVNDYTIENCPICENQMWVGMKVKIFRSKNEDMRTYCFDCIWKQAKIQGIDPNIFECVPVDQLV